MSAQIETIFDQLSIVSNQKNIPGQASNDLAGSSVFADILREQLPSNINFAKPGSQLSIPEGAQTEEFDFATHKTSHIANDTAAETDDAYESDHYAEDDQGSNEDHAASSEDDTSDGQAATSNPDGTPIVNPLAALAGADSQSGTAQQAGKTAAQNVQQANQQQANGQAAELETADIDPTALQQSKTAQNSNLKATITEKQEVLTNQPANSLAASSAIAAQTSANKALGGEKTTVADMLLETSEEAAFTQTISTSGQANAGNGNAAQQQQNQNAQADLAGQNLPNPQTAINPQQASATSAALNAAPQNAPAAQPLGLAGSMASAIPMEASLTGQLASTDSATGGMVIEGQNGQTIKTPAPAQAAQANRPTLPPQLVSDQVSVNIQRAAGQGQDRIQIQLRPYELGRIDVTMEMAKDGKMTAVITAEKQETLEMLKSDSSNLIKSLNDAGMNTDSSSLSFNLGNREGAFGQFANGNDTGKGSEGNFNLDGDEAGEEISTEPTMLGMGEEALPSADGSYDVHV